MKHEYLSNITRSEANFILTGFLPIPKFAVTLLSASGGTGKTRLALVMADKHICQTGERVALWLTEDYTGQIRASFEDMAKAGITKLESMEKMIIITEEPPQLAKRDGGLFKANYDEIKKIGEFLIMNQVKFVVFDPLLAFYGGNENDNSEARVFVQGFAEWAKNASITTLIIHHSNKDGASRGATAFHDGVRCRYELTNPEDDEIMKSGKRTAVLKKDNWGARKHLWELSDGKDEINIQIMPKMAYIKSISPIIVEYSDNGFSKGLLDD